MEYEHLVILKNHNQIILERKHLNLSINPNQGNPHLSSRIMMK